MGTKKQTKTNLTQIMFYLVMGLAGAACGILMMKGDQEFLNYINFVLAELRMDGTMAKLEEKYLK